MESALASSASELNGEVSRDGRWLAYQSDASGRFEIYVRPFPDIHSGRWQVSTDGGTAPLWGPDMSELFFVGLDGRLLRVPVRAGVSFEAGRAEVQLEPAMFTSVGRTYDLSPDGERFLVIRERATLVDRTRPGGDDAVDLEGDVAIQIVLNWFQELERLAPTH